MKKNLKRYAAEISLSLAMSMAFPGWRKNKVPSEENFLDPIVDFTPGSEQYEANHGPLDYTVEQGIGHEFSHQTGLFVEDSEYPIFNQETLRDPLEDFPTYENGATSSPSEDSEFERDYGFWGSDLYVPVEIIPGGEIVYGKVVDAIHPLFGRVREVNE